MDNKSQHDKIAIHFLRQILRRYKVLCQAIWRKLLWGCEYIYYLYVLSDKRYDILDASIDNHHH